MKSLLIALATVASVLAFQDIDLSKKGVIWNDGLSPHVSIQSATKETPKYTLKQRDDWKDQCTGGDACGSDGVSVVYELSYEDGVWLPLCMCNNFAFDAKGMASTFAYVPLAIRSSVNKISAKATGNGAYTMGNSGVYLGKYGAEVFIHESGHSFDYANSIGDMKEYLDALTNDTCMPDPYARSSKAEAWAQTAVLWTYLSLTGASESTMTNHTFNCWSNTRKVAMKLLPYNKKLDWNSREQLSIGTWNSSYFLNVVNNDNVVFTTQSRNWQLVQASYNYWLICDTVTHQCLDGVGNRNLGTSPRLVRRNATQWQQWSLEGAGGVFKIRNRANGLYLNLGNCGGGNNNKVTFSPASFDKNCQSFAIGQKKENEKKTHTVTETFIATRTATRANL